MRSTAAQKAGAIAILLAVLMFGMGLGAHLQSLKGPQPQPVPVDIYLPTAAVPHGVSRLPGDSSVRAKNLRLELADLSRRYGIDGRIDYCLIERFRIL